MTNLNIYSSALSVEQMEKKLKKEGVVLRRVNTLLGEIWSGASMGKQDLNLMEVLI